MKPCFLRSLLFSAILFAAFSVVCAQSGNPGARIFDGETLNYEGKVNKILHGIPVADLIFTATLANDERLVISSQAASKRTLIKLFRYSFLQQYGSTVDRAKCSIL